MNYCTNCGNTGGNPSYIVGLGKEMRCEKCPDHLAEQESNEEDTALPVFEKEFEEESDGLTFQEEKYIEKMSDREDD